MGNFTSTASVESRLRGRRSLARKYSVFTGALIFYVAFLFIAFDIWADTFHPLKALALTCATLFIAGAISRYTNRVLALPLQYLLEGISAVRQGRLEPIQVSRTGDEVEFVTESFNGMIQDLAASRSELRKYHESLEDQVRARTKELEEASAKALAASKAKSEFLANVSHELRTPMAGILGMIDIVLDGNPEAEQREHLLTAKSCANTLLALMNDILDISKIEAGKMVLEEIPFEVRRLVDDCAKSLAAKAASKGVGFHHEVADDVPLAVTGDPLRLRQVLVNLLSNAVKFTEAGSVVIRASVLSDPDERQFLAFEVRDTGPGIPPEKADSIFEEFTQADGSISRRYGGTGLGLAITKKLVEMHGGRIRMQSEVGRGSTFRVEIPCCPVCTITEPKPADPKPVPPAPRTSENETILIVEDNLVNQRVVSAMLKKQGYRVVIAGHGGQALEAIEREMPALVLMDLQMPEVDGFEATRQIRRQPRWRTLPIVAMTAHAMSGDRELCLEAGMDGYLSKPVNRAQLVAQVEESITSGRARGSGSVLAEVS